MRSDKELLTLAAKAADYEIILMCDPHDSGEPQSEFFHLDGKYWNPLSISTGDALRLAVKLRLLIGMYSGTSTVWYGETYLNQPHGSDPYAATCRAIVRAAAEIGASL